MWFTFKGTAHPPVTLTLVQHGKVVNRHRETSRCSEDDIGTPRGDRCSIYVACGVVAHARRITESELDLVIVNTGDELQAQMTIAVDDNPR